MYNLRRLATVARQGWTDLLPAVGQAFNDNPDDDKLDRVYGTRPRLNIFLLALGAVAIGELFAGIGPDFEIKKFVNWPAVAASLIFAFAIRRYLFGDRGADPEDFPWLAASLLPAVALLVFDSAVTAIALGPNAVRSEFQSAETMLGPVLVALTDALGVAAALTIVVATLCFSRNWIRAVWDMAVRLLVFKVMVWVTAVIVVEVGIVGAILSALLESLFGLRLPAWLPELADQITYAGLLSVAYLAVIGATWTVCRTQFGELLRHGQVDVLASVADMAKNPDRKRKKDRQA